ncbi:MAG TPA: 6-bladed beta-propeller, partial [Bacteroidetes bacterium]|nr:6-bladed beta-propeller [Bacteroidota bacterium]
AIIGDINKIILYDNKLFANDGSRIIVFDNKGKYLFKIEKLGRGPGEYTDITDLTISNNIDQSNDKKIDYV